MSRIRCVNNKTFLIRYLMCLISLDLASLRFPRVLFSGAFGCSSKTHLTEKPVSKNSSSEVSFYKNGFCEIWSFRHFVGRGRDKDTFLFLKQLQGSEISVICCFISNECRCPFGLSVQTDEVRKTHQATVSVNHSGSAKVILSWQSMCAELTGLTGKMLPLKLL